MTYDEISSAIMNENDDLVYIADPKTYELLYINRGGCQLFGENYHGKKCYQYLQNRDTPCPFCTNSQLSTESYYIWEHFNEIAQRHYLLKDKLIMLEGKLLRLEICTDVTDKERASQWLQQKLAVEETLVRCIQTLTEGDNTTSAINNLLTIIGQFYQAQRAYIFEFDLPADELNNTYERCFGDSVPQIDNLQNVPMEAIERWVEQFRTQGEFFITSLGKALSPGSLEYQILAPQGVESLMAAPLVNSDGEITGFIGVDNPSTNTGDISLLRSVTYFVVNDISKRKLLQELERMSFIDMLTGLENRNSYMNFIQALTEAVPQSLGVVYADVNGLKQANDTCGHKYGDRLIVQTTSTLRRYFPEHLFRVGGDEFVALCPGISKNLFDARVSELRNFLKMHGDKSFSLGANWTSDRVEVQEQILRADSDMYAEKQLYHSTNAASNSE